MKRILALFLILVFLLPCVFAGAFSSYDFTFYPTADKSMMEFSKKAVGIDYTGYGFLGSSSIKGLYIRLGIQTPYDNLINALLELMTQAEKRANTIGKEASEEEMEKSQEIVSSVESALSQGSFIPSASTQPTSNNRFDAPPTTSTAVGSVTPSTTTRPEEISPSDKDSTSNPENDESLIDIDNADQDIDTDIDSPENDLVKDMNINWTLSFTVGPAYRSFMGDNALVYMGLGLTNTTVVDYHFDDKTEMSQTNLSNTIGADIDFGIRFDVENRTTLRIGTHITTDLVGWNSAQQKNKENDVLSGTFNFYGYAFAGDSIFTNMDNIWYVRLATTFKQRKTEVFDYINPSSVIGGGYLIPQK